jgi:putative endonuclease
MGETTGGGLGTGTPERAWVGTTGETWAALHLQRHGYRLWARNWRNPHDEREEIDLIARHGTVLVFVEVRTRRLGSLVPGVHSLNVRKKRALRRAIRAFLQGLPTGWRLPTTRVDLIEISWQPQREPEIRHFEGISLQTPRPFR